jgi:hypothetical protein
MTFSTVVTLSLDAVSLYHQQHLHPSRLRFSLSLSIFQFSVMPFIMEISFVSCVLLLYRNATRRKPPLLLPPWKADITVNGFRPYKQPKKWRYFVDKISINLVSEFTIETVYFRHTDASRRFIFFLVEIESLLSRSRFIIVFECVDLSRNNFSLPPVLSLKMLVNSNASIYATCLDKYFIRLRMTRRCSHVNACDWEIS